MKNRLTRIYNGIAVPDFLPRDAARREPLGDKVEKLKDAIWVGTIAELTDNKGLVHGIHAVSEFVAREARATKNISYAYIIIGEGEDHTKLEKLIRKKGIQEYIYLLGHKSEAVRFFKAFDVFILPSLKEGSPYMLLEVGLVKVLLVASNTGGIPEIIEAQKTKYLVTPKNIQALANTIDAYTYETKKINLLKT